MVDILRIGVVFALIVLLLRRKWGIGYVMLVASAALAGLSMMPPAKIWSSITAMITSPVTFSLAVALTFIKMFELILREKDVMRRMMDASRAILKNRRAVIVSMPLLIGMLPSVGGAYFSAPMVEESSKGLSMTQEEKAFLNYWYRHPWEYILPLYPGVILASAITGIELWTFMLANLAYAVAIVLGGVFIGMKSVGGTHTESGDITKEGLRSFMPIVFVLLLVVLFRIKLHFALMLSVAGLFLYYRYGPKDIYRAVKHGFSPDVLVLIAGVMLFKEIMDSSGAVGNISRFFADEGIPLMPMLFLLPFATGLLTGLTVGFVSATFPLLISFMGGAGLWEMSFAFAAGFMGVLLSPVHVCLVLTREYFRADMWGMYRMLVPASAIIAIIALAQYFIMS